jgi:hypothetical protein
MKNYRFTILRTEYKREKEMDGVAFRLFKDALMAYSITKKVSNW